jgi:glutamyl-tRNA synthetase
MSVRVRFAPSPTGHLHVGGARTALYNWLFARGLGGVFVLRIEDTDAARSTEQSLGAILSSLEWLGLAWDEGPGVGGPHAPYFQAERRALYHEHAARLRRSGRAYPCFCTAEEIERRRGLRAEAGEGPGVADPCRDLSEAGRSRLEAEGRPAALRFRLEGVGETAWEDVLRGRVAFRNDVLDDFVLLRSDGGPTYNFACVVDDHLMEISHVVRGDDHISNTPRQLQIYAAFGWEPPRFAHVPMILGPDGSRLSKRHGATSVEAYRDLGYLPAALDNFLALLGWAYDGRQELFSLPELVDKFRLERVGSNPAVFNGEKLEWINAQHLKRLPEEERVALVTGWLERRGHSLAGRPPEWRAALVRALGERLKTLADAEPLGRFALADEMEMDPAAWAALLGRAGAGPRLAALAGRLEADAEFSLASLEVATRGLAAELGVKAGELIGAARIALTGSQVSPGIFEVMWLLGREKAVDRLRRAAARWERERAGAGV